MNWCAACRRWKQRAPTPMLETQPVRVSYLISTRNRADYLERTLANIREFITVADELIVVDGASTDRTSEVAARNKDVITRFVSEPDHGEAHGYNKAVLLARGQILKFITDDDYIYPEAMRQVIRVLEARPEIDALLCGGESRVFDPATGASSVLYYQHLSPGRRLPETISDLFHQTPCGLGLVVRRRVIAHVGLFDATFRAVDSNYISRLLLAGVDFRYFDCKVFQQTIYPHSLQNDHGRLAIDRIRLMLDHGTWQLMLHEPMDTLAGVLGLGNLPGGKALMLWIWYGERLRYSRLRPLLVFGANGLHWLSRFKRWLQGFWWWILSAPREVGADHQPLVEPPWDFQLR